MFGSINPTQLLLEIFCVSGVVSKCMLDLVKPSKSSGLILGESTCLGTFPPYPRKGLSARDHVPTPPQQNGILERMNRHILITVRALPVESLVTPTFWCELLIQLFITLIDYALMSWIISLHMNACLTIHLLILIYVFCCLCFMHPPSYERTKLLPLAANCVFGI